MKTYIKYFSWLFLFVFLLSSGLRILYIIRILVPMGLMVVSFMISKELKLFTIKDNRILYLWMVMSAVYLFVSLFEVNYRDYFELKQYVNTFPTVAALAPMILCFTQKKIVFDVIRVIKKYYIVAIIPLFLSGMVYWQFLLVYATPLIHLTVLWNKLTNKMKIIMGGVFINTLLFMEARASILKWVIALFCAYLIHSKFICNKKIISVFCHSLIITPIILLILGITNIFNVFDFESYMPSFIDSRLTYEQKKELYTDTRSDIYENDIISSVTHNSIVFGRTPAHYATVSMDWGEAMMNSVMTNNERKSEVGILSIYAWFGLFGGILYMAIFYKAFLLSYYRSNNVYVKSLGVFVCFYWLLSWIEIIPQIDIMYCMFLMILGICYSKDFREMTNLEFNQYLKSLLNQNLIR